MFKLSGRRPKDLGFSNGRFTARPTWKPNWVSSQVEATDPHYIAPLAAGGDARGAMPRLKKALASFPRVKVVEEKDGYLHAEFSTALMGFTDDVEFAALGDAIQVRSSSRLGIRDLGVNRKRIEAVRAAFAGSQ